MAEQVTTPIPTSHTDRTLGPGMFDGAPGAPADSNLTDQIKRLVLARRLRPGDPLPTELELCTELGASRTSVREAVKTLAALDIVNVRHGRGTFVGDLSLEPLVDGLVFKSLLSGGDDLRLLRDLVDVRASLESTFISRGLGELAPATVERLSQLVAEMEQEAEHGGHYFEQDREFHELLLSAHDNRFAVQLVAAFWDVARKVIPILGLPSSEDAHETAKRHRDLLDAVLTRDPAAVAEAIDRHFQPVRRRIMDVTSTQQAAGGIELPPQHR